LHIGCGNACRVETLFLLDSVDLLYIEKSIIKLFEIRNGQEMDINLNKNKFNYDRLLNISK